MFYITFQKILGFYNSLILFYGVFLFFGWWLFRFFALSLLLRLFFGSGRNSCFLVPFLCCSRSFSCFFALFRGFYQCRAECIE